MTTPESSAALESHAGSEFPTASEAPAASKSPAVQGSPATNVTPSYSIHPPAHLPTPLEAMHLRQEAIWDAQLPKQAVLIFQVPDADDTHPWDFKLPNVPDPDNCYAKYFPILAGPLTETGCTSSYVDNGDPHILESMLIATP